MMSGQWESANMNVSSPSLIMVGLDNPQDLDKTMAEILVMYPNKPIIVASLDDGAFTSIQTDIKNQEVSSTVVSLPQDCQILSEEGRKNYKDSFQLDSHMNETEKYRTTSVNTSVQKEPALMQAENIETVNTFASFQENKAENDKAGSSAVVCQEPYLEGAKKQEAPFIDAVPHCNFSSQRLKPSKSPGSSQMNSFVETKQPKTFIHAKSFLQKNSSRSVERLRGSTAGVQQSALTNTKGKVNQQKSTVASIKKHTPFSISTSREQGSTLTCMRKTISLDVNESVHQDYVSTNAKKPHASSPLIVQRSFDTPKTETIVDHTSPVSVQPLSDRMKTDKHLLTKVIANISENRLGTVNGDSYLPFSKHNQIPSDMDWFLHKYETDDKGNFVSVFQCKICDQGSLTPEHLYSHSKSHEVIKVLRCLGCGRPYRRVKMLLDHKKVCNYPKNPIFVASDYYSCLSCCTAFPSKVSMNIHQNKCEKNPSVKLDGKINFKGEINNRKMSISEASGCRKYKHQERLSLLTFKRALKYHHEKNRSQNPPKKKTKVSQPCKRLSGDTCNHTRARHEDSKEIEYSFTKGSDYNISGSSEMNVHKPITKNIPLSKEQHGFSRRSHHNDLKSWQNSESILDLPGKDLFLSSDSESNSSK